MLCYCFQRINLLGIGFLYLMSAAFKCETTYLVVEIILVSAVKLRLKLMINCSSFKLILIKASKFKFTKTSGFLALKQNFQRKAAFCFIYI